MKGAQPRPVKVAKKSAMASTTIAMVKSMNASGVHVVVVQKKRSNCVETDLMMIVMAELKRFADVSKAHRPPATGDHLKLQA